MWFGTMSGLNRFDGYTFKKFRHNPDDSSSINDSYINSIGEDHLGRLWINTRTGLTIYDPETETFSDRYRGLSCRNGPSVPMRFPTYTETGKACSG